MKVGLQLTGSDEPQQQESVLCSAFQAAGKHFDDVLLYRIQLYEHQATLLLH
jgi:hypothetical protein